MIVSPEIMNVIFEDGLERKRREVEWGILRNMGRKREEVFREGLRGVFRDGVYRGRGGFRGGREGYLEIG